MLNAARERNSAVKWYPESPPMTEFKDKIPTGGGKVEYLYSPDGRRATRISGFMRAVYMVAVSMDGRRLLSTIPAGGIGHVAVYPQPSVTAYIQSDEQCMWGRNCPYCQKYFRTNHIMDVTHCPYCSEPASSLAFVSKDQRAYITACYDAFARSYMGNKSTSVDEADITDSKSAWHYAEVKQQFHFKCETPRCETETDMLGDGYGYCPRCGRTNARKLYAELMDKMLIRWDETDKNISERKQREEVWEDLTVKSLFAFEPLAKHLRCKLLCFPMTARRRKQLENLNFQKPLAANDSLMQWFDIGMLEWNGNDAIPKRAVPQAESLFIKKMVQRRHILTHNGGIVDHEYLDLSEDTQFSLGERIRIGSQEAKRFVERVRDMGANLLDNVEDGFRKDGP
jgi:hypothetical protein